MNFTEKLKSISKKILMIRLKLVSERFVSLFSKQRMECVGLCFDDPITGETNITVMNAFGLIIPSFSHIPLELFLKSKVLEEAHLYEISNIEARDILSIFFSTEHSAPEIWIKRLCQRFWASKNKEKNPFLKIISFLENKKLEYTFKGKKFKEECELQKKDIEFMIDVWPFIYALLMENEFRFALAIANEDSLVHIISGGIENGFILYDELLKSTKYKALLPKLAKNKIITLQVEPSKTMEEICSNYQIFISSIINSINKNEPVEIHFSKLIQHTNDLFQTSGYPLIQYSPEKENKASILIFNEDTEKICLKNNKEIILYNYQSDFPEELKDEDSLREILFFIDSIATPEKPYENLRSVLVQHLFDK